MGKKFKNESVVHDWVSELPFMQQALLMTAMRGPDGCTKHNTAKEIVKFLRGAVLKPAMFDGGTWPEWISTPQDSFMRNDYLDQYHSFDTCVSNFFWDTDVYPMHFLMHLVHAAEVVGYKHPDPFVQSLWLKFYYKACNAFHMTPETAQEMDSRMKY